MVRKSETLNLRVTPEFKELLRLAADQESRSISNLLEVLVRDHCKRRGMMSGSEVAAVKARKSGRP